MPLEPERHSAGPWRHRSHPLPAGGEVNAKTLMTHDSPTDSRERPSEMMRWVYLVIRVLRWSTKALWTAVRRWPAAAIVIAGALSILVPLGVDYFFAIPPPVREAGGWCIVAGFLGLCLRRLWRIEPEDDAPPAERSQPFHWSSLLPALVCVAMAVPYLRGPAQPGIWRLGPEPRKV